ncbi:2OG-Fe(II) oxygenase family protein [Planktotalea sp.]|uniref:isopenicillin N synthase family dioxygenase n=1 Tax=Planktotalea sp. TaxID=2029877 RepID=UPI00329A7081
MDHIPVLDLNAPNVQQAFFKAYSEVGFAYLVGHGIDPAVRQALFKASKAFHALPEAIKRVVEVDRSHRGYIPMAASTDVTSTLADVTKPNQSSSFMMMREDAAEIDGVYLSGPNKWPELEGFRSALEQYNADMCTLADRMMRLALSAIDAPETAMDMFAPPTTWLRLLHYPPSLPSRPDDLYGSAPHTDFGALTFLATDDVGGLQVLTPKGDWIDVPPREDAFVVNVGDMLHRLSNGVLRSTPHRVINTSGRERYSCPFFYDPHVSATIVPLEGTGAPQFGPLNFGDFLRGELEASYDAHKPKSS